MTGKKNWFTKYNKTSGQDVTCASDFKLKSESVGIVTLNFGEDIGEVPMLEVMYVSRLKASLISMRDIVKRNYVSVFTQQGCTIKLKISPLKVNL